MTFTQKIQLGLAFTFGVIFLSLILAIAILIPNPTRFQYEIFRITIALAAGGAAAVVPGILNVRIGSFITAGGALAVFVVVYFYSPAQLAVEEMHSNMNQDSSSFVRPIPTVVDPPDSQNYRFTDNEIAAYKSEVTLVRQLIEDGTELLNDSEAPYYYSRVKVWEDSCMNFLVSFDRHHQNATDFSYRFEHWDRQARPSNIAQLPDLIVRILVRNLSTLEDVQVHAAQVQPKTEIVYVTRTGSKYHRGTCSYLRKSKIPMDLKLAASNYSPCSVCRPPRP